MQQDQDKGKQLKIVGIGASASGLEALTLFFSNCPDDSGLSFIVVQHLSPDFRGGHDSPLSRKTKMPITVASEGLAIESNHIYLIPGEKNIMIQDNELKLLERAPEHELNLPIDILFTSLADEKKEDAVGVILSGSGSDGTKGAAAIKEAGGTIFVQKPEESGFSGMPLSVIHSGLADFVLNAADIPNELLSYFDFAGKSAKKGSEQVVDNILEIVKEGTKYDFTPYRKQTLHRRIIKRKNINKIDQLSDYENFLIDNQEEQDILVSEFLIGVTRFFRDRVYFETLQKKVFPEIIASKKTGETIKSWVIGCVTGEEAYSLAMLLKESLKKHKKKLDFKIFATDINVKAIEKASKGHFGPNIAADIPPEYLSQYFKRDENGFVVLPHLRKHIIFSNHDILNNPPFNKMDLISCRNLLIYFQRPAQEKTIKSILYALNLKGYLFLGTSESLGKYSKYFEVIDRRGKIFRKEVNYDSHQTSRDIFSAKVEMLPTKKLPEFASELTVQFTKKLAQVTDSLCICVNENIQILEVYGSLRLVGSLPAEGFSSNLFKLLPKEFHVPIATAVRMLSKSPTAQPPISKLINFSSDKEKSITAKVIFDRFDQKTYPHEKFYLIAISIEELSNHDVLPPIPEIDAASNREIQQLQNLLEDTRENLQLTIEELESTNEEAQATNEELVSSNEELQSTNEELQSVNEELYTVNAELQEKNIQLLELNADIENLMNSSHIATLFLDDQLKIRKFTPSFKKIIDLQESDIGRSITNFSLPDKNFLDDLKYVIKHQKMLRKEIVLDEDKRYLQEINSYVSGNEKVQGAVINYTNISDLNLVSFEIKEKIKLLEDLLELFPGIFFIFDLENKKITFVNPAFEALTGYRAEEVYQMGSKVFDQLCDPEDKKNVQKHFEEMEKAEKKEIHSIRFKLIKKNEETVWVSSKNKPFAWDENEKVKTILSFLTVEEKK